jgi:hypothetical protein
MGMVAAVSLLIALSAGTGAIGAGSNREDTGSEAGRFQGKASPLDPATRRRITGSSWHPGCPVGRGDLRLLRLSHFGFDGEVHKGRLIVHEDVDKAILRAMRSLYRHRFPIRRMRLVDAYGADDHRSMDADNTSAFNCRFIAGQSGVWSQHAYGKAIDINPIENPYVTSFGDVSPPAGAPYANRSREAPGMIHSGDATVRAFTAIGWGWGGRWSWPKDYQHFSANGH